jgi:hypothetical protein
LRSAILRLSYCGLVRFDSYWRKGWERGMAAYIRALSAALDVMGVE